MKILVDTNVVLDVMLDRSEFVKDSLLALEKAMNNGDKLYFSSSAATDVYYVVRRETRSKAKAIEAIQDLCVLFDLADVNSECISDALFSKINDFEDAVIDTVASKLKVDYLMTRNINDFQKSKNAIITPSEFLYI